MGLAHQLQWKGHPEQLWVRGTDKIQPNPLPNGALASAQVEVPEDAIEKGCDRISIKSLNRDPKSSIGHLFLIE